MSYICHSYHIVFSSKNRRQLIQPEFQKDLYGYIAGIIKNKNGMLIEAGGVEDHIHLLARLHQGIAHMDVIRDVKSQSSKWVNDTYPGPTKFQWQIKYGSFTVSRSREEEVAQYIRNQKEHHRKVTFKEEFLAWLDAHGCEYDERYLWE